MSLGTDNTRAIIQLDTLPTEIQDLIFNHVIAGLSRNDLKQFRQSNRFFRAHADTQLFRTLHVSASKLSLNRIKAISEQPYLSSHVRELVYHRGTFSGHKMVHHRRGTIAARDYGDFEAYMMRGEPSFRPAQKDMMRVSACFVAFEEEVKAEADFNRDLTWQRDMAVYCARFPNLAILSTVSDAEDLLSEYLLRRCGLTHQSWTPNYFAPYEIFAPCGATFRPRALRMDCVNGEDFAATMASIRGTNNREGVIAETFSALRELTLRFSETVVTLSVEGTYDAFIAAARHSLRCLTLDFTTFYSPKILNDPDALPQRLINIVLGTHFPRLAHLELVYPIMLESAFTHFLTTHAAHLRGVTVRRWAMPVTRAGQPTGSVIRALWSIGRVEFLMRPAIVIQGEISSLKSGDGWSIKPIWDDETTLSTRICRYLNRAGSGTGRESVCGYPIQVPEELIVAAKEPQELLALDEMPHTSGAFDHSFMFEGKVRSAPHSTMNNMVPEEDEDWTGAAGWLAGTGLN